VETPTLESEGPKTHKSAVTNPLRRHEQQKKQTAQDQDEQADHLKQWKPGEENPLKEPLKFRNRALQRLNPNLK